MTSAQQMYKNRILIIDDDSSMRQLLEMILKDDYHVLTADGAKSGVSLFKEHNIDIVLLDIRLGDGNGIEVLKQIKKIDDTVEVIMITVVKDVRTAVEAMQCGAYDYINKDFDYDEVKILVQKALQKRSLSGEVRSLRDEIKELTHSDYVLGFSTAMQEVNKIVQQVAKMPSSVLITGESGTGKEVIARQIHDLAYEHCDNQYNPFVAVNISSIPSELIESTLFGHEKGAFTGAHRAHKGKFELAHNGTLFLDEIAELRQDLQSKLLRAIQERQIDRVGGESPISVQVRIIAATNQNLLEAVQNGQFREDLYYRLNVIPIMLPPLRERLEDLTEFVKLILTKSCKRLNKKITGIAPEVMDCLTIYPWPGNVRELENVIERMVALSDSTKLSLDDVPIELRFNVKAQETSKISYEELLKEALDTFEKRFILSALNRHEWHQINTADELGIHRKTLEYKIKKLNLQIVIDEKKKQRIKKVARTDEL